MKRNRADAAREALAGKLRDIDGNGFVPDQDPPAVTAETFDERFARTRENAAKVQAELMTNLAQIIYELGRLRGILEERNNRERT